MRITKGIFWLAAAVFVLMCSPAYAQLTFDGNIYTKFLWGTDRLGSALYAFTTIPGEGLGDSGQGSQFEFYIRAKFGRKVEMRTTIQSRFIRNYWTNGGGFGPPFCGGNLFGTNPTECLSSEWDPRSNQYVKLRGIQMVLTPGYSWLDNAVIGENDLGQYDPVVIGRIRYIDRFNAAGVQLSGSANNRQFTWDLIRISLLRNLGPFFNTGQFQPQDGTWAFQPKLKINPQFDVGGLIAYTRDIEVDSADFDLDDGRSIRTRFGNTVGAVKVGIHPSSTFDVNAAAYFSNSKADPVLAGSSVFSLSGFSATPLGSLNDQSYKVNVDINDPFQNGLSFNLEYFNFGKDYVSIWAARRESDVLLTEGFDGSFAHPEPMNSAFGVFAGGQSPQPGNPTRTTIGYGGWSGPTVQVATIQADNDFTDFDEPLAETVIGWHGITIKPVYGSGSWDVTGEYTYLTYDTNGQAFDDDTRSISSTIYPIMEGDTGVGHNYRNAYAPFRERTTQFLVGRAKYSFANGVEVWGKYKHIDETDDRLNETRFLPFQPGDCPGGGVACTNVRNEYSPGNSTADIYGNPPVITVNGVTGYQWKPFDSITDDDRDLSYNMFQFGVGKQLTGDFYSSAMYERYNADLQDGNTAFQAYQLHQMASGKHHKNKLIIVGRYILPGLPEAGFQYEYNWGDFEPDFGGGFVPQIADETISRNQNVPVGSPGFFGRFGGWNSLASREFSQNRFKGYMKIIF